jgi:hypothetical protein
LWHWPLLVFAKFISGDLLTPIDRAFVVAAALVLAALTYRLIERPLARLSLKSAARILGAIMIILGMVGISVFAGLVPSRLQAENVTKILNASYDWKYPPVASTGYNFGVLRYFVEDSNLKTYTLFLGDSNMEQYAPRIDRAISDNPQTTNGAIFVGNQNTCSLLGELLDGANSCPDKMRKVADLIGQPSTRAVTIAGAWGRFRNALDRPEARQRFIEYLRPIVAANKKVFIVLNIPTGPELSPSNMFAGTRLGKIVPKPVSAVHFDFERFEADYAGINRQLSEIALASGATLLDPVSRLCPQRQCPVFDKAGNPLYRDAGHVTQTYAIDAATFIDETLKP